ncbi:MAG: 2-hydroxyacyl-CoA dehydratase family protein [Oscillospiraceae bacterium]
MIKRPFKERYPTVKSFLKGDPPCKFIGDHYIDKTNVFDRREWRGVRDTGYTFAWWLATWGKMTGLVLRDPVRMARAFWKYRWLSVYLITPHMTDEWLAGDRGPALRGDMHALNAMISDTVDALWLMIRADRRLGENKWTAKTIPFDYTLPRHLMFGFPDYCSVNINTQAAFMLPVLMKQMGAYYIDASVSCGIPQDLCTLPLTEVGVAVEGEYPDVGNCWLSTNNPCDANMMDNAAMYRALSNDGKKAVHSFVTPLMYDDPTTKELSVHEVYAAIDFLEKQLGEKFNWDSFARAMEVVNQINREELERWDVYAKTPYGALNGTVQGYFRIYFYQVSANKHFARESAYILKLFNKCVDKKRCSFPNARHRAVLWSCGSTYYCDAPNWLYNCWGITTVINMDSLTGHSMIDTSDRETMISDVAELHARTPMRTHTVGGNRHILQVFETARKFNCDMIVMYDDIGCKGMAGCQGLLEEEIRAHSDEFHILWMPHALMDYRTVTPAEARKVVNDYMFTVMHEEPLDPSLVDYDDSEGW